MTAKKEVPETFTRKQVEELLERQKADCADQITADSLTGFTAKRLIIETKLTDF
jgi:hypothetical protein